MAYSQPLLVLSMVIGAVGVMTCESQCKPWKWAEQGQSGMPCKTGKKMDFRFLVGDVTGAASADGPADVKTYFFCPEVDDFSSLVMDGAIAYLNATEPAVGGNASLYLAAYGTGKSSEIRIPDETQNTHTMLWQPNHEKCANKGGAAIANFLIYNTTLDEGDYKYKNGDPIGNGFVDTCNEDGSKCHFDDNSFCIGKGNSWNCAACVGTDAKPEEPKVLVSFYGTDSGGKHLLSGSSNPLNFRRFALGNVYTDLRDDVVSEYKSISKDVEKQWNDIV